LWRLVLDGNESSEKYLRIAGITFSPNSQRLAFIAVREDHGRLVCVDGKKRPQVFDGIGRPGIIWSPDSRRVAYAGKIGRVCSVFLNGKKGPVFDDVYGVTFSPDGRRWAYMARKGQQWFVMIDGKKTRAYEGAGIDGPKFSPDSRHIAYTAKDGNDWIVCEDGTERARYPAVHHLTYSPKGGIGYYAKDEDGRSMVIIDGQVVGSHESMGQTGIVFSSDGEHYAYSARDGADWFAVHNGRPGPRFRYVGKGTLTFGPQGKQLAYAAAMDDANMFAVLNDRAGPRFDKILGKLIFSPSGKKLAFRVLDEEEWAVVVNGTKGPDYDMVLGNPIFVKGRLEYVAVRDTEVFRVQGKRP
jgi:Tol biopolymer transport system component